MSQVGDPSDTTVSLLQWKEPAIAMFTSEFFGKINTIVFLFIFKKILSNHKLIRVKIILGKLFGSTGFWFEGFVASRSDLFFFMKAVRASQETLYILAKC